MSAALPAFLHPFAKPTRESFVRVVRGEGALLWTADGQQLIDGMASLWYCAIGHGRVEMAEAVAAQMSTLESYSTFDPFTTEPAERLAEELVAIAPMEGARVFFTCSGSEAIDSVMKLARIAHVQAGQPQRKLIISRVRGYHGVAYGGTSAQGIAPNREHFGPFVDQVVHVPADDVEALSVLMARHGSEIAAVVAEPVQGAGGVFPAPEGYLQGLRKLCDQHGAYLIFDEVICGFGRMGTWFAAEHFGVTPDMITFAKGVSSGYQPVSGVVLSRKVLDPLEADPTFMLRHGYTYSGHPAATAGALANLEVLADGVMDRAPKVGARLSEGLRSLASDGTIADVRGAGAVWAAQLNDGQDSFAVRDAMLELGVAVRPIGTALAFCPPLVITDEQIDTCVDVLAAAVNAQS